MKRFVFAVMVSVCCVAFSADPKKGEVKNKADVIEYLKFVDKASPAITDERLTIKEGASREITEAEVKAGLGDGSFVLVRRSVIRKMIAALESQSEVAR